MRKVINIPSHHDFPKREYFITKRAYPPKWRYLCVLVGVYCELDKIWNPLGDKSPGTQGGMIWIRLALSWEYWSTLTLR